MNWKNITLGQFQDIHKLSNDAELDDIDRSAKLISIVYGLSEQQVDDLELVKFNQMAKDCSFLLADEIPGKAVKSFRIGTNKYAINYNPASLKHRQYVEILHFSDKPLENMHNIMASLVSPVKWGRRLNNKADDHAKLSAEMQNAPFIAIYHACIFFCKLYKNSIVALQDYLIAEMMKKGMTETKAKEVMTYSINGMDGFIQRRRWPNMSA